MTMFSWLSKAPQISAASDIVRVVHHNQVLTS